MSVRIRCEEICQNSIVCETECLSSRHDHDQVQKLEDCFESPKYFGAFFFLNKKFS